MTYLEEEWTEKDLAKLERKTMKIKNLAELKRALTIANIVIRVLEHWQPNLKGTTRTPIAVRKNGKPGVQTNGYYFMGPKQDGTIVEMWCALPKASELRFEENGAVTFYHGTDRNWTLSFEIGETV